MVKTQIGTNSNKTGSGYGGSPETTPETPLDELTFRQQCQELQAKDQENIANNIIGDFCLDQKYRKQILVAIQMGLTSYQRSSVELRADHHWYIYLESPRNELGPIFGTTIQIDGEPACFPPLTPDEKEIDDFNRQKKEAKEKYAKLVEQKKWDELLEIDKGRIGHEARQANLETEIKQITDMAESLKELAKEAKNKDVTIRTACDLYEFMETFGEEDQMGQGVTEKIRNNNLLNGYFLQLQMVVKAILDSFGLKAQDDCGGIMKLDSPLMGNGFSEGKQQSTSKK